MPKLDAALATRALRAVGQLLADLNEPVAIVVVGGTALNLLGFIERATSDVDVIAQAERPEAGDIKLEQAEPFPPALQNAIERVARDFGLDPEWMNADVGKQGPESLPPATVEELSWRTYGGLTVGLVGRRTLIALKLFAAVDQGPRSVHVQDLLALAPSDAELEEASEWVKKQDASHRFKKDVDQAVTYVREHS